MAEKPSKKSILPPGYVSVKVLRERQGSPPLIFSTAFRLRVDKKTGMIEVVLEGTEGRRERVMVDPFIFRHNLDNLTQYVSGLNCEPDDDANKEEIPANQQSIYSNF